MRRRILALLCAVLLTIQMASLSAQAAGTVYFTAINETVLELSDATMPFWSGGYLYVAGSLFESKELETGYFYNAAKNMAVVYSKRTASYALFFDLNRDSVDSADGYGYYPPAIARNGTIFLPVGMVSSYFNLTYTNSKVPNGYLIRVRSGSAVLSDREFIDAAGPRMNSRYEDYQAARADAQPAQPEPPEISGGEPPAAEGQTLRLCFRMGEPGAVADLLNALDSAGAVGTFYLTAEEIRASGDLVRRMAATGHSLGLAAKAGAGVAEQLQAANEALWQAAGVKTRLCVLAEEQEESRREAEQAGYCCLQADIDRSASGLKNRSGASSLFSRVSARRGAVTVWLADQTEGAGLRAFLTMASQAGDRLVGMTETA